MQRAVSCLLVTSLMLANASCASIVASGPDLIPVNSEPAGATVYLDGIGVGKTPTTVAFPRKSDGVIRLEKDGYQTVTLDQDKVLNGWFLGNLVLGGLLGIGIDLATSNQGKYSTTPISAVLPRSSDADPWGDN